MKYFCFSGMETEAWIDFCFHHWTQRHSMGGVKCGNSKDVVLLYWSTCARINWEMHTKMLWFSLFISCHNQNLHFLEASIFFLISAYANTLINTWPTASFLFVFSGHSILTFHGHWWVFTKSVFTIFVILKCSFSTDMVSAGSLLNHLFFLILKTNLWVTHMHILSNSWPLFPGCILFSSSSNKHSVICSFPHTLLYSHQVELFLPLL